MALGTQPHGKLLDYEQFIDHQLRRTRARIKMTDILTACVTLATAVLGVLFLEVRARPRLRPAALVPADHPAGRAWPARRCFAAVRIVAAAGQAGQRALRGQDDRGGRPDVQEQPDQLPRPPEAAEASSRRRHGGRRGQGRRRPDPGRDRHRRQPAPADPDGCTPWRRSWSSSASTPRSPPSASSTRPSGPSWPTSSGRPTRGW